MKEMRSGRQEGKQTHAYWSHHNHMKERSRQSLCYMCVYVYVSMYICVCVYVCVHVHVCVHVCVCTCVHVCVCVCVYVCMCVHHACVCEVGRKVGEVKSQYQCKRYGYCSKFHPELMMGFRCGPEAVWFTFVKHHKDCQTENALWKAGVGTGRPV